MAVFFLRYLYGNDKGSIQQGQDMNSPFTGVNGNFNFSNDVVDGESLGLGDGTVKEFKTTLAYTPIRPATAVVYVGEEAVAKVAKSEGGKDTLEAINNSGFTGEINLETGEVKVSAATAPKKDSQVTIQYRYDMDMTTVGFSQVDLDLESMSIEAFPRKLRSR